METTKVENRSARVSESRAPIKNILFPTDFSEAAHNAFEYTLHLAEEIEANVLLLHVYYETPTNAAYIPQDIVDALREEKIEKVMKYIHQYQDEAREQCQKDVEIRPILENGFAADTIVQLSKEMEVDLIVMGTQGAESFAEKILGSVTTKVIEHAKCPVLAVPAQATYQPINHIMYAAGFEEGDSEAIDYLLDLCELFDARLSCAHVRTNQQYWDKVELSFFEKLYQMEIEKDRLAFYVSNSDAVINGIQHFINTHRVDMLSMLTHERKMLNRIYGSDSITRQMTLYTDVPLLAFHAE